MDPTGVDDDEDFYGGLYEDGHWEWNELIECLVFKSDLTQTPDFELPTPTAIGCIEFKNDLDLIEQQRFRKRYQRKISADDVITLQDIKDVVLFTAPKAVLTISLVNVLHLPTTERFMRALIAYCQFYLQIADEMARRMLELQVKVRTIRSDEIESKFRENLEDLRLLVAKEYCSIIMAAKDFSKYHHMGPNKKSTSLSKKEAILFESILRIGIQMVWLALGRKSYHQLEIEIHRMFKSDIFNIIEHKLNINYSESLDEKEQFVLFGHCLKQNRLTNSHSPLMNEIHCDRDIDYRLMGLGVIKYRRLNSRLRYFENVLIAPETVFKEAGISLGILGLPRSGFDTMLNEVKKPLTSASATSATTMKHSTSKANASRASRMSTCSGKALGGHLYEDIYIPEIEDLIEIIPEHFPTTNIKAKPCNADQRKKWLAQAYRLQKKPSARKKSKPGAKK